MKIYLMLATLSLLKKNKEVFKYKFIPEKDSYIEFGVKNVTGTNYITIGFKDVETTQQAEILFMDQFK